MESILSGKNLEACNKAFLEKHQHSFVHRAAAAEILFLISKDKPQALKLFFNLEGASGYRAMKVVLTPLHPKNSVLLGLH